MSDMLAYEQAILEGLSSKQKALYLSEVEKKKKGKGTAILFALFLGNIGIHHFYLGKTTWGIFSILFCWTFIPGLIALIECFGFVQRRVDQVNRAVASETVQRIQLLVD